MGTCCNGLLNPVQTMLNQRKPVSQEKNSQTETSDFQTLLAQKRTSDADGRERECTEELACNDEMKQEAGSVAGEETADIDLELHKQMAWAFFAAVQYPVIQDYQSLDAAVPFDSDKTGNVLFEGRMEPAVSAQGTQVFEQPTTGSEEAETLFAAQIPSQMDDVIPAVQSSEGGKNQGKAAVERDTEWMYHAEEQQVDAPGVEQTVFRDIREIPIKVGETSETTVSEEANSVETQLNVRLCQAIREGETVVELQLEPESLGRIQVKLTQSEDGTLHISMLAESSHTRTLLEKDLTGLQAMLGRNAQQEVQVEVSHQESSHQQNFYDGRQGSGRQDQQREQRKEQQKTNEDFLQQLRLGLYPLSVSAS